MASQTERSALEQHTRGLPRLAPWEFAGLMVTYWCNAKCAFCYVYSGPDRGGNLSVESAVELWRGLDAHAAAHGHVMRVHLAGGEPFVEWEHLVAIIRAARDGGRTPLEMVETNAFWCRDDDETRTRLRTLDELGMERLVVSADVYHQEFVPFERVERCVRLAREVLGEKRVRVRWWDFSAAPVELRGEDEAARHKAYRDALQRHQDRLTGRAADRLAGFYERFPAAHFEGQNCVDEVLHGRHVHIDPYGNVFPGVCAGIILGNGIEGSREQGIGGSRDQGIGGSRDQGIEGSRDQGIEGSRDQGIEGSRDQGIEGSRDQGIESDYQNPARECGASRPTTRVVGSDRRSGGSGGQGGEGSGGQGSEGSGTEVDELQGGASRIERLWENLAANWREHPVVGPVVSGGSHALFRKAVELGYVELRGGYANKCHLCTHVRQFLFEHGGWERWVGPAECYANAADKVEAQRAAPFVALSVDGSPLARRAVTRRRMSTSHTA